MRSLGLWIFGLSFFAAATFAPAASASGRFPASSAIVFDPHDAKTVYVRTTFGLVASHDGGDAWSWICPSAIGLSGMEDPSWVVTPKGALVGNTAAGLAVSRDGGCTFSFAGGPGAHVLVDLTMRRDGTIFGVASGPAKIVSSNDDAQTFTQTGGPIDASLSVQSIRVSPTDPARLYLSVVRGEGDKRTAALLASYDAGMSWVERKFDLAPGESGALLAAVDPKNADRVYVRTSGDVDTRTRLMVTDDGGKTWKKAFDAATPLLSFALADDGSQVFVGAHEGVSYAPAASLAFVKGSSADATCLGLNPENRLWACSTDKSGFFVGVSNNGGRSLDGKLRLEELKGALACPAGSSVAMLCNDAWPNERIELGLRDPNEKPRTRDPSAPALRGRGQRSQSTRSTLRGVSALALMGMAGYYALRRFMRRKK